MRRRDFIAAFAGAAVCPFGASAQQPKKVARIGLLVTPPLEAPETRTILNAFYQGLREHGYIDGQNVIVEVRVANSKIERFPALANEFLRSQSRRHRGFKLGSWPCRTASDHNNPDCCSGDGRSR
jgi:putative ABC transport system substrate-binding protein